MGNVLIIEYNKILIMSKLFATSFCGTMIRLLQRQAFIAPHAVDSPYGETYPDSIAELPHKRYRSLKENPIPMATPS